MKGEISVGPLDAALLLQVGIVNGLALSGHGIAVEARQRMLQRHRVFNLMTHVDPWRRPDLDHAPPTAYR